MMGIQNLDKAAITSKHICMLLGSRRKLCTSEESVNGGSRLRGLAEDVHKMVDEQFAAEYGTSKHPPAKKPSSLPEKMHWDRLASKARWRSRNGELQRDGEAAASTAQGILIRRELARYLAEDVMEDCDDFSLLQHWRPRTSTITGMDSSATVAEAVLPHLGLLARLDYGIGSTNYQAAWNLPVPALLISNLRKSMLPGKVEKITSHKLKSLNIGTCSYSTRWCSTENEYEKNALCKHPLT